MGTASKQRQAWGLLAPMLAIMAAVTAYPLVHTLYLGFTDASLGGDGSLTEWVGLENYLNILTDPGFQEALGRTTYFTVVSVGIEVVLGILVGLLLNEEFVGRGFVRVLLVLPWALPTIVNAMMWRLIYNPEYGSLNALLTQLGLLDHYRSWLGSPASAMNAIIAADVWKNYPLVALFVLAALQTIPANLYEAARMDGAGPWQRFRAVTLPGILGALSVALVLRTIEAFKVFDIIYVMTRGGPADSTKTLSFLVYQESFAYLHAGSGASYAVVVTLIAMVMIAVYILLIRRQEHP
jgi:multiple sugar transport system permease protein